MSEAADRLEQYARGFDILNDDEPSADGKFFRAAAELVRSLTTIASLTGEKYCELCVCSLEPDSEGHEDDCLLKKLEEAAKP